MEEIKYFNGGFDDLNNIHGSAAKAWAYMSILKKSLNLEFAVPSVYIFSYDEIIKMSNDSFDFPVKLIISNDETIYKKPFVIESFSHLLNIIAEYKNLNETSFVFLPCIQYANQYLYVLNDGFVLDKDNKFYNVPCDLSGIYSDAGISKNIAMLFRSLSSGLLVLDSFIDRNNEYLTSLFPIENVVSDESFNSFRTGFLNAFLSDYVGFTDLKYRLKLMYLNFGLMPISFISGNAETAIMQGAIIGASVKYCFVDFADHNKLHLQSDQNNIKSFDNLELKSKYIKLGNEIIANNKDAVAKLMHEMFSNNNFSIKSILNVKKSVFDIGSIDFEKSVDYSDYNEQINPGDILNVKSLITSVSFDSAQFRIIDYNDEYINLRFQAYNCRLSRYGVSEESGIKYILHQTANEKFENNYSISKSEFGISENDIIIIPHLKTSLMGTGAKYAECYEKDGNIFSSHNDIRIGTIKGIFNV